MLANSLADVVAEKASKRLLPDLNQEPKAKRSEQTGTSVAKIMALVQADIWTKREEAGKTYKCGSGYDSVFDRHAGGRAWQSWACSGKTQEWHEVSKLKMTALAGKGKHCATPGRVQEKSSNVSVPPKDSTPSHVHLHATLLVPVPRRNLLLLCWKRSLTLSLPFWRPVPRDHLFVWRRLLLSLGEKVPVRRNDLSVG